MLGGYRRGLGSIRRGSREPDQAVAPLPAAAALLSVSRPACPPVCPCVSAGSSAVTLRRRNSPCPCRAEHEPAPTSGFTSAADGGRKKNTSTRSAMTPPKIPARRSRRAARSPLGCPRWFVSTALSFIPAWPGSQQRRSVRSAAHLISDIVTTVAVCLTATERRSVSDTQTRNDVGVRAVGLSAPVRSGGSDQLISPPEIGVRVKPPPCALLGAALRSAPPLLPLPLPLPDNGRAQCARSDHKYRQHGDGAGEDTYTLF